MEASPESLALLLRHVPVAVAIYGPDGRLRECNAVARKLLGLSKGGRSARGLNDAVRRFLLPDGSRMPAEEQPVAQVLSRRVPVTDRLVGILARGGGRRSWVRMNAVPRFAADGSLEEVLVSFVDVTDRAEAEAKLTIFRSLADQSREFIGMCDMNFRPFYVNEAGRQLVGLDSLKQACDTPVKAFFFPEDQRFIYEEFFPRVLREGRAEVEVRFRHFKTGTALWMNYNVFRIRDGAGRSLGFATVSRDITARKRADEALRSSEQRFRTLFQQASDAIVVFDPETLRPVEFNTETCRRMGYSRKEFFQLQLSDLDIAESPTDSRRRCRRVLANGLEIFETRQRTKSGKVLDVEVRAAPIQIGGRRLIQGFWRDITERKRVESALRETTRRLRAVMNAVPVGIGVASDPTCTYLEANPAMMAQFDAAPGDNLSATARGARPLGRRIRYYQNGRRLSGRRFPLQQAVALNRAIPHQELEIRLPGGRRWFADVSAVPIRNGRGQVSGGLVVVADVTERRQVEERLRQLAVSLEARVGQRTADLTALNERLHAILGSDLVGIITFDEQGAIDYVNPAAERLFGYGAREVVGRNVGLLIPAGERGVPGGHEMPELGTGDKRAIGRVREVLARREDGTAFPLELSMTEFVAGGRRRFAGIVRNISMRRRLESEVTRAFEQARHELGIDLHDGLGQHLQGLKYLAADLEHRLGQRAAPEAAEAARFVALLDEGIEQARHIAHGLRPVENTPEALMAGLRQLVRDVRRVGGANLQFYCRRPVLVADNLVATHLFRIAQEAVNNALKHAACHRIAITLSATPEHLLLVVRDDGVGLRLRREPGIGLHVMQYRANAIHGSLIIRSLPGRGTEVRCAVPCPPVQPPRATGRRRENSR